MAMLRHVPRALHDDHMATVAALERLEALLGQYRASNAPDAGDPEVAKFLMDLRRTLAAEVGPHFAFEEEFIFPRLAEAGDREMSTFLEDEHRTILPLAERLVELAKLATAGGFTPESWAAFHATGAEFVERLISHVQKEEMGLLPALDDLLDDETDGALALEFAARR